MKMNTRKGESVKKNNTEQTPSVKIIPLGGLEQIGMNITAIEYEDTIVVIDCGLAFPEEDMLGIDLVIPDVSYLKDNIDKVKGLVVTDMKIISEQSRMLRKRLTFRSTQPN